MSRYVAENPEKSLSIFRTCFVLVGGVVVGVVVTYYIFKFLPSPMDWILSGAWLFYIWFLEPIMFFGGKR